MRMDQGFRSKRSLFPVQFFAAIFVLFLMVGCVISPRRTLGGTPTPTPSPTATPTPNPAATGKLYVSNSGGGSILRFDNAFTASRDATPAATISRAHNTPDSPRFMTLDGAADRLVVAKPGGL